MIRRVGPGFERDVQTEMMVSIACPFAVTERMGDPVGSSNVDIVAMVRVSCCVVLRLHVS